MIEFLVVPAAVALAFGLQIRDMTRRPKPQTITQAESAAYREAINFQRTYQTEYGSQKQAFQAQYDAQLHRAHLDFNTLTPPVQAEPVPAGHVRVREMDFTREEWAKLVAAVKASDDTTSPLIRIQRS